MFTKARSIVGVVLLSFVLVPSTVFSQDRPTYDTTAEYTVTGVVDDLKGGRSAMYWFSKVHTLGFGHMRAPDKQLLLKTDSETLAVQLGPAAFLDEKDVEIRKGDTLEVTGSRVTSGPSPVILARQLRKGSTTWVLRDPAGQPLWSSTQAEPRRFWTTKKILVVAVVAKVVLLTTVLRH